MATALQQHSPPNPAQAVVPRPELVFAFDGGSAGALALSLCVPLARIVVHRFPDNEACVRLADTKGISGLHVAVYRSLNDPDSKIIEILLAASALRDAGARSITLIAPYLCYMRQDRAFHPGEAVSQRVIGQVLARAFDAVVTVEPHLHRTHDLRLVFGDKPSLALTAAPAIAGYLRRTGWLDGALLLGPDEESAPLVERAAACVSAPWAVCRKVRTADRSVRVELPTNQSFNRPIVIIDDVISTGATIARLAEALRKAGAGPIRACATHALFDENAVATMRDAGVLSIASCDGVPHPSNAISIAPVLAAGLSTPESRRRTS